MAAKSSPKAPKATTVSSTGASPGRRASFSAPPAPRVPTPSWSRLRQSSAAAVVGIVLLAAIAGYGGSWLQNHNQSGIGSTSLSTQKKIVTSQSQLISQIAKTVGPSVVSVNVSIASNSNSPSSLFGFSLPQNEQAAGTGIIISSDGVVMTNRHVVPVGTTNVSVTLSDGTELKDVSVIGRSNDSDSLDVAFLKINNAQGHKLAPAALGDSTTVQVGDDVVAIGNALGQFQNTVTTGIISGFGRSVQAGDSSGNSNSAENLDDLLQTDAAINEGNSGGPLVNLNGQVIGLNTAIAGNAQNIGFAIPINDLHGLIDQVLKTGKFERPYLGVHYVPLSADVSSQYHLSVQTGAFIIPSQDGSSVVPGSPAEQAGLKEGDVITAVDSTKIDQSHSLTGLLSPHQPGDRVQLTVLRGDKTLNVAVTLGTLPDSSNR